MPEHPSLVGPALRDAKRELRTRIVAARDGLDGPFRARASAAIAARIAELPSFRAASTVLLTLAYRSEWDTMPLVRAALSAGKVVLAPRVDPDARVLGLYAIADPDADLEPGYRGIREPRRHCAPGATSAVDWVLVPGVAFDAEGRRLGYGGGFYDRLLPEIAARAPRVAGAFEAQLVGRVPAAPHDQVVDMIVTEARTIAVDRARPRD